MDNDILLVIKHIKISKINVKCQEKLDRNSK